MKNRKRFHERAFRTRSLAAYLSVALLAGVSVQAPRIAFGATVESWKAEWEQTVAAAKKEGEVSFYGSQGYEKVFEVFQKKYPEIKVKSNTTRRGSEHGQAVMTERRAGQYLVDLFINGVVTP